MTIIERTDTPPNGKAKVWWRAENLAPPWEGGVPTKDALKAAGFWFDGDRDSPRFKRNAGTKPSMCWWTADFEKVLAFAEGAKARGTFAEHFPSTTLRDRVDAELHARVDALAGSRAAAADVDVPLPAGRTLYPFQCAGVRYVLDAFARGVKGVLLGDQMGLGKTPQAIASINALADVETVLVVCPKSALMVWQRHAEQWLTGRWRIIRLQPGSRWPQPEAGRKLFVIVNFDIVARYAGQVERLDLLVVDEAHFCKNPKAQRTRAIFGSIERGAAKQSGIATRYRLALTGTPIPNRPVELWPIISWLDPDRWPHGSFFRFAVRYCDANQSGYGGSWDFSGHSNLAELQDELRSRCMVRRLKSEVLTELPAKVRTVIELDAPPELAEVLAAERSAFEQWEGTGSTADFSELSRIRHEVGVAKADAVIEHLRNVLDERGKAICFGWHRDVLARIADAFPGESVLVTGSTGTEDRERLAGKFQTDPSCRLFVGNMQAAGTAITLTASDYVCFAEEDWTPGNLSQAEDRAHRIGQRGSVLIEHLVFSDSLDARMVEVVIGKQKVADAALDDRRPETEPPPPVAAPTYRDATSFGLPSSNGHAARRALALPEGEPGTPELTRDFLLAGNAIFTVSDESGAWRYTYRIRLPKTGAQFGGGGRTWFAGVLVGPENTRDYDYAGIVDAETLGVRATAKSKVPAEAPSMQVLRWALRHVAEGRALPAGYAIHHMGRCGRCGRALTVPSSVETGLGPECAGKL